MYFKSDLIIDMDHSHSPGTEPWSVIYFIITEEGSHILTPKMIWEPLNCRSFLDKIILSLHENALEISLKIVYERI